MAEFVIGKLPNLKMLVGMMVANRTPCCYCTQHSPSNKQATVRKVWQHDTIDGYSGREVSHLPTKASQAAQ